MLLYDDDNDGLFEVATSNTRLRPKTTFSKTSQQHENVHIMLMHVVCHARTYAMRVCVHFIERSILGSNKQVALSIIVLTTDNAYISIPIKGIIRPTKDRVLKL